ncbi:hypothetical protein SSX86_033137 [Deinandra increscens subsp. villosa]|uniref:23 kDa subunit of oxygen evolving system of photosystem II n=1 Tax=Deinandra increscens subsp. villosa TaxID=3103831 RepID=A0AAP0C346_9ASTR
MASTVGFLHPPSTAARMTVPPRQASIDPHHLIVCRSNTDKKSPAVFVFMPANVFGKPKKNTDFVPYKGEGFKLSIPAKWNPSKEVEYPGQVLRYEDNFDTTSNLAVIVTPTDKKSVTDYGGPEEFLSQVIKSITFVS